MIIQKTSTTQQQILSDLLRHTTERGECLEWNGCFNTDGYPRMVYARNPNIKVHRFVAELHYRQDITGQVVRHSCDNPKCINPSHLILGTPIENVQDRVERGRTYKVITKDVVLKTKKLLASKVLNQKEIAVLVGIDQRRVSDINCGLYDDEGKLCR